MTGKSLNLALTLFLLLVPAALVRADEESAATTLVEFEIEDQFDDEHTHEELRDRVVLVLCGDREGSKFQGAWVSALRDSMRARDIEGGTLLIEVADVRGVPFFIKGRVKGKFSQDPETRVLMDWDGTFAKAYRFEKDKCNILLFDAEGSVALSTAVDAFETSTAESILARIAQLRTAAGTAAFLRAAEAYQAGEFAESEQRFARCVSFGAKNPTTFYNAACSAALASRPEAAFEYLHGALERGFRDTELLSGDGDLASLHEDPRWAAAVARSEQNDIDFLASIALPEVRAEILEMKRIDQAMRRGESIPELEGKTWGDVDGANTARMKEIVAEHGWPAKELVGEDGAGAAWLLVQHADADPAFQRRCLELMAALPPGEVSPVDLAYLTDRVLVNEGRKQIYGTQFWTVNGETVPRPIEDESMVEALRAEAGMGTMQDYHRRMTGRDWVPKVEKR